MQEEEPVFDSKRERDQYHAFREKVKSDLNKERFKTVPAVKTETKKLFNPVGPCERNNALKVGKKLELHYKNDYSIKPKHLPEFRPKFPQAARILIKKRY